MGTTVVIRHSGGYVTTYSCLSEETAVAAGDTVSCGDTIGTVGQTALTEKALEPMSTSPLPATTRGWTRRSLWSNQSARSIFFIFFLLKECDALRRSSRATAAAPFPRGNRSGDFFVRQLPVFQRDEKLLVDASESVVSS